MTTPTRRPLHTVSVDGDPPKKVTDGSVVLDALTVPYGTADIFLPLTTQGDADIDPRDDIRAVLLASADRAATTRTFDLGIRERTIDHVAKTVHLLCTTDESRLMDYAALVAEDYRAHEGSLRAIVNAVLAKIGAVLEPAIPGVPDPPMTAYWDARNMVFDPGTYATAQPMATGWNASACTLDTNDTSWSISGDGDCFNLWGPTAADSYLALGDGTNIKMVYNLTPGKTYVFSATGNTKVAFTGTDAPLLNNGQKRTRALSVHMHNGVSYIEKASAQVTATINTPQRVSVEFTIPLDSTGCILRANLGNSAGQIRWDGFRLSEKGPGTTADNAVFFDGNTADTANYVYSWEQAVSCSPSARKAVVERLPEMFTWNPGVTAWEFLQPFLTAAGQRLYCDERRKWRLIDPTTYSLSGFIRVSPDNGTEGRDLISRMNGDVFSTGVVVVYEWTDEFGARQVVYDSAGTPSKVYVVTYATPYPGPGAAAAILARRNGTGRVQETDSLVDWTTTPAMTASINLPGTPEQQGKVSAVTFSLGDSALMGLTTSGLVEIPDGSIDKLPGIIDALVGTIDNLNPI